MSLTRLINSGSNCYLNSTLQGMSSCPQLVQDFRTLSKNYDSVDALLAFNKLLEALTDKKKSEINARQNQLFNNWKKTGQQDSFEILSYMLMEIYEKLQRQDTNFDWSKINLPLRIIFKHEIECCNGHKASCPTQIYLALHVPIPENLKDCSIQNLLNKFMEESEIEDYICDECMSNNESKPNVLRGDESNAKKFTNILCPLPNTICIHLQRTRWRNGSMKKINDKVKIDEKIRIKYTNDKQSDIQEYNLRSVIVHSGTPFFGHYICYKKEKDTWYYTSDRSIKAVKTKSVPDCQAYILFYENNIKYQESPV